MRLEILGSSLSMIYMFQCLETSRIEGTHLGETVFDRLKPERDTIHEDPDDKSGQAKGLGDQFFGHGRNHT